MKALTIHQHWAELILQGRKQIELCEWTTAYHGLLVIHAGGYVEEEARHAFGFDPAAITRAAVVGVESSSARIAGAIYARTWRRAPIPARGRAGGWPTRAACRSQSQ